MIVDDFDHVGHRAEVEERWGADAYASGDRWWRAMDQDERDAWRQQSATLIADWVAAAQQGLAPDGEVAQALAERQSRWLASIPGTPGAGTGAADPDYLLGLGEMYVADERFAANYGGAEGAAFVRDALRAYGTGRG